MFKSQNVADLVNSNLHHTLKGFMLDLVFLVQSSNVVLLDSHDNHECKTWKMLHPTNEPRVQFSESSKLMVPGKSTFQISGEETFKRLKVNFWGSFSPELCPV